MNDLDRRSYKGNALLRLVLVIAATILFLIAALLILFTPVNRDVPLGLAFLAAACLAGGHVVYD